jgi:hypothetical protein
VIAAPIACGDAPALCEQLRRVVADSGAPVVVCDVRALPASAAAVDALARLQLTARRLGSRIRLQHVSRELDDLLAFAGLADALARRPCALRVEPRRQPEVREQPLRVEEAVDRDDAAT